MQVSAETLRQNACAAFSQADRFYAIGDTKLGDDYNERGFDLMQQWFDIVFDGVVE